MFLSRYFYSFITLLRSWKVEHWLWFWCMLADRCQYAKPTELITIKLGLCNHKKHGDLDVQRAISISRESIVLVTVTYSSLWKLWYFWNYQNLFFVGSVMTKLRPNINKNKCLSSLEAIVYEMVLTLIIAAVKYRRSTEGWLINLGSFTSN